MSAPVIELKDTSFSAQDKTIVRNISIAFAEGETVALIGPSGGGKSTVLKLAAGLILPSDGEVLYRQQDISLMNRQQTLAFRKEAAFVFQDSALWANQTLRQSLELPLMIHFPKMTQNQRTARITEVMAEVGYKKTLDIRPSQLSMGEQKLIAFARAQICSPNLLFLDEWTESLDDSAARRLVNAVRRKQQNGTTIVFVSHNFKVIREVAQKICMIVDGQLSLSVTAEEFSANENLAKMIEKGIAL
jgi:phospholipid/cholesterol/gamma-HCH transport system ATP-binding protein